MSKISNLEDLSISWYFEVVGVIDFKLDLVFFCMSILTEDEYRELFEVASEYREMLSRLSDGRMDLEDGERPEGVEELIEEEISI